MSLNLSLKVSKSPSGNSLEISVGSLGTWNEFQMKTFIIPLQKTRYFIIYDRWRWVDSQDLLHVLIDFQVHLGDVLIDSRIHFRDVRIYSHHIYSWFPNFSLLVLLRRHHGEVFMREILKTTSFSPLFTDYSFI